MIASIWSKYGTQAAVDHVQRRGLTQNIVCHLAGGYVNTKRRTNLKRDAPETEHRQRQTLSNRDLPYYLDGEGIVIPRENIHMHK